MLLIRRPPRPPGCGPDGQPVQDFCGVLLWREMLDLQKVFRSGVAWRGVVWRGVVFVGK